MGVVQSRLITRRIVDLPRCLIVNIKRFSYGTTGTGWLVKENGPVRIDRHISFGMWPGLHTSPIVSPMNCLMTSMFFLQLGTLDRVW